MNYKNTRYLLTKRPEGMPEDDCWAIDEEAITTTYKKKRKKKETKTETKETPIDLAIDIRKSGMLSTSDQGWNSTMGRRIHIPNQ